MTEFTRRQKELLENEGRQQIYGYLEQGVEPATLGEIATDLALRLDLVLYDLQQLREAGLVARIPAQRQGFGETYCVATEEVGG